MLFFEFVLHHFGEFTFDRKPSHVQIYTHLHILYLKNINANVLHNYTLYSQ